MNISSLDLSKAQLESLPEELFGMKSLDSVTFNYDLLMSDSNTKEYWKKLNKLAKVKFR